MSLDNLPVFSLNAAFAIILTAFFCNSIILFSLDGKLLVVNVWII